MPVKAFVKMLVETDRPALTDDEREAIIDGLDAIYWDQCREDPVFGMIITALKTAVRYKMEEDAAFLLDMWADQISHLVMQVLGKAVYKPAEAVTARVCAERAPDGDTMSQLVKCRECEKREECPVYPIVESRAQSSDGSVVN